MKKAIAQAGDFSAVLSAIDRDYEIDPILFENNGVLNAPDKNLGSHRVFSYAIENGLTKDETLSLFREHYKEVLDSPDGDSHPNIRAFMEGGWEGVVFHVEDQNITSLVKKPAAELNPDLTEMVNDPARASYLFPKIGKVRNDFVKNNPGARNVISCGIGDVKLPLAEAAFKAMREAEEDMRKDNCGYGDTEGRPWLLEAIAKDYERFGVKMTADEIFVGNGAKDLTAILSVVLGKRNGIAVGNPTYPVYVDSNAIAGNLGRFDPKTKTYENLILMPMTKESNFEPDLPETKAQVIYLCSPNNPAGAAMTKDRLGQFVKYAKDNRALIVYDAAYSEFIRDKDIPRSIYEIDGADKVAVEINSFSKSAGFTGIRLGWIAIPKALEVDGESLHANFKRFINVFSNGASYISQKMGLAMLEPAGKSQGMEQVRYYQEVVDKMSGTFKGFGWEVHGGRNAPYLWVPTPDFPDYDPKGAETKDWQFLNFMVNKAQVVCTPGSGFGSCGENYNRFSAFNTHRDNDEAMTRIAAVFDKSR